MSSMKWMGFLFCLLLGCDESGLLLVRVWCLAGKIIGLRVGAACPYFLSASEMCVSFSLWRLSAEEEFGSVGETCTSDQDHPMGVQALIVSKVVALIFLTLSSLLGVVSLFLCKSLMGGYNLSPNSS